MPVVERSVTIALVTTRELCLKDFYNENDKQKISKASLLMAQNLARHLALVTCREPLRISLNTHIKELLKKQYSTFDKEKLDNLTTMACMDNLDLGCALIEKAVAEKANHDVSNDTTLKRGVYQPK